MTVPGASASGRALLQSYLFEALLSPSWVWPTTGVRPLVLKMRQYTYRISWVPPYYSPVALPAFHSG